MDLAIQQIVNALSLGSIYALVALGVAIVFSILRLANFAHGELVTVAGYTLYVLLGAGFSWLIAFPAAVLASALAALLLERLAYRRLRGAQPLTLLMTSFAVSVALQGLFLLIFGPRPKGIPLPAFVDTACFALNAANARWARCSTRSTALMCSPRTTSSAKGYDEKRGAQVIEAADELLDELFPSSVGAMLDVHRDRPSTDGLAADTAMPVSLADPSAFAGFTTPEGGKGGVGHVLLSATACTSTWCSTC